ncbi:ATP-binding protein [Streptosporangium sp. NPDC087985]|uniref:ATP-binding protein n=1 Tax=Streptosporangium sp. NPDC087985 TaxID=3366196 RepID=UPI00381A1E68
MATNTSKRHIRGLPAEMTSFVGRRQELAEVRSVLSRSRLVTLVGVGGVGKTRLAFRIAADVRRAFPDGVWAVELATLSIPELLAQTVAEALELQERPDRPSMETLTEYLRDKNALLVLDNCEHLLHDCALMAERLLVSAPKLRIIATSRQALGIAGEQTLVVLPLPLPDEGTTGFTADSLAQVDAVRLFVERAQAVLPTFSVTEANRETVVRICRRLDGIPLAIELAAVRLRALSAEQLLKRLDDRFRLLTGGSRAVPYRHQTLRALVDWSFELCTEPERLLWTRASVFRGGLDLEAAEAVCSGDGIAREEVLDLVIGLVEKSVLVREEHPPGVRYRLLETIRRYGGDRLAGSGEEETLRRRHRDHYSGLARAARAELFGDSQVEWFMRLWVEHPNLRAALTFSFEGQAEAPAGLEMATDLLYYWMPRYRVREGRQWLRQGLAAVTEPGELRARALYSCGWLGIHQGEIAEAVAMLEESRDLGKKLGLDSVLAYATLFLGMTAMYRGDVDSAIKLYEEALAGHRATGDDMGVVLTLTRLSFAYSYQGDSEGAISTGWESVRLCDVHKESWHRAYAMMALGVEIWRQGDMERAADLEKESMRFNSLLNDWPGLGVNLEVLAWAATCQGEYGRAARLLGILRNTWRRAGAPLSEFGHLIEYSEECISRTREALGVSAYDDALKYGAGLSSEEALAYALQEGPSAGPSAGPPSGRAARTSPLTRRERQIAGLVAQGMSNKEIATALVIAQRTAEGHIEHILGKLGFHSRAQIAVWVAERARDAESGVTGEAGTVPRPRG